MKILLLLLVLINLQSCTFFEDTALISNNAILGIPIGSSLEVTEKLIGKSLQEKETKCFENCVSTFTCSKKYEIFKNINVSTIEYKIGTNGFYSVKILFALDQIEAISNIIQQHGVVLQKIKDSYSVFVESAEIKLLPSGESFNAGESDNLVIYTNKGDTYGILEIFDKTYFVGEIQTDEGIASFKKEFQDLHKELMSFKDTQEFGEIGFAVHGPYNNWLLRVDNTMNRYKKALPSFNDKMIHFHDLTLLGMEYVFSKGKETSITLKVNREINDAFK